MLIPSVYMDTDNKSGQQITSEYLSQSSLLGALANAVKDLTELSMLMVYDQLIHIRKMLMTLYQTNLTMIGKLCEHPYLRMVYGTAPYLLKCQAKAHPLSLMQLTGSNPLETISQLRSPRKDHSNRSYLRTLL